jgi:prepilin-type N-terminal cleavage/methylation domain-containing protein
MTRVYTTQTGLTLVEVVVAIAILAFAMAAAGALVTTTTRSSTEGGRRSQASTLATRESESLRTLQTTIPQETEYDTLYEYLQGEEAKSTGSDCFQFVMRQDEGSSTGWTTIAPDSPDTPVRFEKADFARDPDKYFEGYENFSRLITACQSEEYSVEEGYRDSKYIIDVGVRVTWREAGDVTREVKLRDVLTNPGVRS